MNVNKILQISLKYLNKEHLIKELESENVNENAELIQLLDVLNAVVKKVATEYIYCIAEKEIYVDYTGKYSLTSLPKKFYTVRKLKNHLGLKSKYREEDGYLLLKPGKYDLTYIYTPQEVNFQDEITSFPSVLVDEALALGVVAEYFLKYGFFEEYEIYEYKFQDKMKKCAQRYDEVKWKDKIWA